MSSISVSLMIFNLLPLPALDGGQILLITIEKIRKKEISKEIRQKIMGYTFILLTAFGVFMMVRDAFMIFLKNMK